MLTFAFILTCCTPGAVAELWLAEGVKCGHMDSVMDRGISGIPY